LIRKRKQRFCKEKSSNAKGNSFYFKEIVLLTGPHDNIVPRQGSKLYLKQNQNIVRGVQFLKQNQNIVRGVQFSKEWSEQQVVEKVKSLFGQKLLHCNFEFLESVYTHLVPPTLPPGEAFNGMMFFTTFKDKVVYARPSEQVNPLPPKMAKSKKRDLILEGSDSCSPSLADEEDVETDDEIYRMSGLSCRSDVTDCDSSMYSLSGSAITQSRNQHSKSSTIASVSQSGNLHDNSSNATPSASQSSIQHGISDANSNFSSFSTSSTTSCGQPGNQNSKSTNNTASVPETPAVIDLTSEYAYASMFDTQSIEVLSAIDEGEDVSSTPSASIDPQPSAEEILRNLAAEINLDEISKFNISRSNLWKSACRGFKRKSFSPTKKISVKFMDDIGQSEGAIDAGGPRRKFLTLVLDYLRSSSLFVGKYNSKFLTSYALNMENNEYFLAGQIFAVTLVHGGPAPHFLAPQVFKCLIEDPSKQKGTIDDIYDLEVKQVLNSLLSFQ
jgi:hypothetical protein